MRGYGAVPIREQLTAKQRPLSDRYTRRPTNYVQLLQSISHARRLDRLELLVKDYKDKFDAVHVSAAIAALPHAMSPWLGRDKALPADEAARAGALLTQLQVCGLCTRLAYRNRLLGGHAGRACAQWRGEAAALLVCMAAGARSAGCCRQGCT